MTGLRSAHIKMLRVTNSFTPSLLVAILLTAAGMWGDASAEYKLTSLIVVPFDLFQ
jgi:hypothetical protein